MSVKTKAVILAAGNSKRMGGTIPKQLMEIGGRPIFVHTLCKFDKIDIIDELVLVYPEIYKEQITRGLKEYSFKKKLDLVKGGSTRQNSSLRGLEVCGDDTSFVVIHDAARPFTNEGTIKVVIETAMKYKAASSAIACQDTIVWEEGGYIKKVPPRENMFQVQTPQAFEYNLIMEAHKWAFDKGFFDFTDDCGLVIRMGEKVKLVKGDYSNIKITRKRDLDRAKMLLMRKGGFER